ncbi:hypothetical protein AB1K70_04560 [Bremerella sp. JC770]|uniref:hypothetical protein n=1 Tax=Bremerella sp. JC770 TaxID=3232137 RepID=UPI003459BF7E
MSTTRIDFGIGEDADYIVIADAGKQREFKTAADAIGAGLANEAFVLPLPEDGGISGRVVVGELNDDESNHWVARAQRSLNVQDEKVVIDAGDFFGRKTPGHSGNHLIVELEPGQYQLTCLVFLTDNIATHLFARHKFSYMELFQNTFPDQKFPVWLIEEAECRDNETDEEWCETISDDQVDFANENRFVGVLFQFQKDVTVESPTEISQTGKLTWDKRPPKTFPEPLRRLDDASSAIRATSGDAILTEIMKAFTSEDFAACTGYFSEPLQSEAESFLSRMHGQASAKMEIPQRKSPDICDRDRDDWIARSTRPRCLVDVASLQSFPFQESGAVELFPEPAPYQRSSVSFHAAFVKTPGGLRVAALQIEWKVPIQRKRRRPRVADGPPCPECGTPLATALAKQCMDCGANWH